MPIRRVESLELRRVSPAKTSRDSCTGSNDDEHVEKLPAVADPLVAAAAGLRRTASSIKVPARALAIEDDATEPLHSAAALPGRVDGGLDAWLAIISSFLIHFASFGVQYSFGVFQERYQKVDYPNASPSMLSLIGALGPSTMFVSGGLFVGHLAERLHFRTVILTGSLLIAAGLFLASLATQVWQLLLTQGILFGLGCAMVYIPGAALPSQWWVKHQSFASGTAVAGAGAGPLVYTLVLSVVLPSLGTKWTLLAMAGITLALLLVATALVRTRIPVRRRAVRGSIWNSLRDVKFRYLFLGRLIIPFSYLVPFFYLPSYVTSVTPHPPSFAALLLTLINVMSLVGRIVGGWLADRLGTVNMYTLSVLFAGLSILVFWLPAGASQPLLILFAITFGFFAGGYLSLMPPMVGQLFGIASIPSMTGMVSLATAVGNLAGAPLAGALISAALKAHGGGDKWITPAHEFGGAIAFSGGTMVAGALVMVYMRFAVLDGRFFVRY
ncbi:hypothetical protein GGF31_007189 [Allomyces arbusculus]|nr:hypothetical protein GGF31_007189 [Allomyces arbusculus]